MAEPFIPIESLSFGSYGPLLVLTGQIESHYWLWCPILGPIAGAQFGTMFYDAFLYNGEGNKFNRP